MYTAINNRLVVKKPEERKTESGIILSDQDQGNCLELQVVSTTETTKELQDKTIFVERRLVSELPEAGYGTVKLEDIACVKPE